MVMGWLGQMLCSWGSFSMICHWSGTDWEKLFSSTEYGVMIGRTVVGLVVGTDALVGSWRRASRVWRRALEML